MLRYVLPFLLFLFSLLHCEAQVSPASTATPGLSFHINDNVSNKEEAYAQEIIANWEAYLRSNYLVQAENPYWNQATFPFPDNAYISVILEAYQVRRNGGNLQCNVIGVVPLEAGFYEFKTAYFQVDDSTREVSLRHMITVYAKAYQDSFQFVSSTEYLLNKYEQRQFGEVNYLIHPNHRFSKKEAERMNEFNREIARQFGVAPLSFRYVVANNTTDLSQLMGSDFNQYSNNPVPSGGLSDIRNGIIYAGNNSAYYPHEVVHLYTNACCSRQYHPWVDEGIAAFFGGSTGYDIEWHWQKLRRFLADHPDYPLEDLTALQTDIPNGEYTTDFRYAIGGLLMGLIHQKEGMEGLFDALRAGRTEADYFRMLEQKLGFTRSEFGSFIRAAVQDIPPVSEATMATYRYGEQ